MRVRFCSTLTAKTVERATYLGEELSHLLERHLALPDRRSAPLLLLIRPAAPPLHLVLSLSTPRVDEVDRAPLVLVEHLIIVGRGSPTRLASAGTPSSWLGVDGSTLRLRRRWRRWKLLRPVIPLVFPGRATGRTSRRAARDAPLAGSHGVDRRVLTSLMTLLSRRRRIVRVLLLTRFKLTLVRIEVARRLRTVTGARGEAVVVVQLRGREVGRRGNRGLRRGSRRLSPRVAVATLGTRSARGEARATWRRPSLLLLVALLRVRSLLRLWGSTILLLLLLPTRVVVVVGTVVFSNGLLLARLVLLLFRAAPPTVSHVTTSGFILVVTVLPLRLLRIRLLVRVACSLLSLACQVCERVEATAAGRDQLPVQRTRACTQRLAHSCEAEWCAKGEEIEERTLMAANRSRAMVLS